MDGTETEDREGARSYPALELAKQLFLKKISEYRMLQDAADDDNRQMSTCGTDCDQTALKTRMDANLASAAEVKEQADGLQWMILQASKNLAIAPKTTADFFRQAYKAGQVPPADIEENKAARGPAVMEEARGEDDAFWL